MKEKQIEQIMYIVKSQFSIHAKIDCEKDLAEIDSNDLDHIAEDVAKSLYAVGYRKTFTSNLASDTQAAFKEGYLKGIAINLESVAERLKNAIDKAWELLKEYEE